MASPVLEPKNIRAISLSHVVVSYHTSQPTQIIIVDPKAVRNRLGRFARPRMYTYVFSLMRQWGQA